MSIKRCRQSSAAITIQLNKYKDQLKPPPALSDDAKEELFQMLSKKQLREKHLSALFSSFSNISINLNKTMS